MAHGPDGGRWWSDSAVVTATTWEAWAGMGRRGSWLAMGRGRSGPVRGDEGGTGMVERAGGCRRTTKRAEQGAEVLAWG